MKNNRRNVFLSLLGRFFSASAIVISFFGVSHAAQQSWKTDAATTAWATGTNWVSGTAPTSSITADTALFNQTAYTSQPDAGTTSITGITIGDGVTATAPLTLSGTQLTIGAGGINQTANAGATSLTSPVTIGAAQTWTVGGSSTLTTSGAITGAALTLTTTGTGNLNFAGGYTGTGTIRMTSAAGTTSNIGVQTGANISSANIHLFQDNVANGGTNYTQTGGTVSATSSFGIGESAAGGTSGRINNATISGGTLNVTGTGSLNLYKWATSNLNVSNSGVINAANLRIGWVDSSPTGSITLGDGTNFSGGTNISDGGTSGALTVNAWNIQNNRNYTLNFKGGTLKAGAASTNWLAAGAFASANVQEAGGILDNGGFAVTLGQAITHGGAAATDGGMVFKGTGSTTLAGAVGYTGPTKVLAGSVTLPETVVTNGISLSNGATLAISGTSGKLIGAAAPISNLTLGSTPAAGGATLTFNNFVSNSGQQLVDTADFTVNGADQGVTINVAGSFSAAGDYPLVTFGNPTIGGDGIDALTLGTLPRGVTGNLYEDSQILWLGVTGFNPLRWNGTVAGGVWDVNTTANWQGVDTKYQNGDVVILDATATGTTNVVLNSTVSPASVAANNSTYSVAGTGSIAGTTGLSKNGTSGTLTLGTNNTYLGLTSVTGGTLKTAHANALGSTAGITEVASGAVLDLNGTALAAEPVTLNGTGISSTGALVNNSASIASASSPITLGTAASVGGTGLMTLSGDITGTTGLTKLGLGVTSLSSRKSYTGDTVVNAGILDLSGGGGTGGTIRGAVTVNSGATLRLGTGDATGYALGTDRLTAINILGGSLLVGVTNNQTLGAAALTVQGGTVTGVSGSNLDFYTDNNALPGRSSFTTLASATPSVVSGVRIKMRQNEGVTFDIADGAAAIDLDIQSNLASDSFSTSQLVKNGAGTMRLSGLSTYAYPTMINAGALIVPAVQSSTAFTLADGTTLGITGAAGSSLSTGSMTIGSAGSTTLNVGNFGSQTLAANAPVKVTGLLTLDGTPTLNISGNFATSGVFPVVSYGSLGGLADFQLGTLPRSVAGATLVRNDTNLTYDLNITGVNPVSWNGNVNGNWDTSTANWRINAAATTYQNNDVVVMNDSATGGTAITLSTTVTPNSLTVDNTTKAYSIAGSGSIGGSGSLTKSGTGTLTLATANTFSGITTVNAGTLQLGNGTSNGSVAGNITNNASLVLNNGTAQTYDGIISGTGSLTKQGAGTFALTTAPTSTGTTTITAGTLQVPSLSATSSITNNANLTFKRFDAAENNPAGVITGAGNVAYTGPDQALSGIGYYRLDDANTYAGTTTISNSRAAVFKSAACSTGAINVTNGGQFWTWNFGLIINNPITLNGIGWNEGSFHGAIRLNKAAVLTGPITLASDSRISVFNSGATDGGGTISGVISGPGGLEITGNQFNLLALTGSSSNTYSGATRITSGQVALNKSSGLALTGDITMDNTGSPTMWPTSSTQLSPTALLTFTGNSGNARFNLMGTTQTFRGIVNNSTAATAVIQNSEAVGTNPNASPLDYGTSNLVLNVPTGEDYSFLNVHLRNSTGVLNVVKNGLGRQTVGGSTTVDYSGTTTINAGELRFYDMDDTQSRAVTIASGATLRVEALTTRNFNGNIFGGAVWNGTGNLIMTGAGIKQFNGDQVTNISFGSGALVDVQQGVLRLGFGGRPNMSTNKADLNVASGATFNTWDTPSANEVRFDALTGSGIVTRGYTPDTSTNSSGIGNLVLGVDNGSGSFTGVISDQVGNVGSILNLVKRGAGTQTLSGVNDYDGTTRVEGGTLALSGAGDLPNSTGITVLSGAVLDVSAKTTTFTQATGKTLSAGRTSGSGNDIVGNLATGGTISVAGNGGIGTLTVGGNLSLTGGGALQLELSPSAAGTNDKAVATGTLDLAGTTSVTPVFNGSPDTVNPYTILSATGGITGAGTFTNGLVNSRYALAFNNVGNDVQMTVSGTGKLLTWSAATGASWEAPAAIPDALTLNWNAGVDNFQNLDAVTFDDTAAGTGAVTVALTTNVNPAAMSVNNPTRDYTISGTNGVISGGGKLTKAGAGALTLATANSYSGGTSLNQGTLNLTHGTAAGTGAITLDDAPAGTNALTLNANLASATFANPITVTNNGTGTVTLAQPANFSTLAGTVTLNRPTTISGPADRASVAGKITGNVGTLSFSGGRTTLNNPVPNDFVGNVSILTGATLQTDSMSSIPASASVDVVGTGKLQLNNGFPVALNTLTGGTSGTTGLQIAGGGPTTLTLGGNGGSGVFNGNITNNSAALSITKVGAGTLTLGGNNSNYGQTRVLGGTLALTHLSALGGSTLVWDNLGGALDVSTLTTGTLNLGGLLGAQNLTLSGLSLSLGHASNTDSTVYTGAITLTGAGLGFTKQGLGNQTLGGSVSNSWAGNTTILTSSTSPSNQASLVLAKTGGAVAIPANTTVNFGTSTAGQANIRTVYDNQFGANVIMNVGNATNNWCRFDLLGTTQTLAGVTGSAGGAIIQNTGLGNYTGLDVAKPATLVLTGAGTYSMTGILRDTDAAANPLRRLNIHKTGSGTQTFAAVNGGGMTGSTIVDAGTLVINRTGTGDDYYSSTGYSVAAGAVLQFDASANGRLCSQVADVTGNGTIRKTGAATTFWANNGSSTQVFLDFGTSGLVDVQGGNLNSISTRATNKADILIAGGATLTINGAGGSATTAYFDGLNGGSSTTNATLDIGRTTVLGVNGDGGTFFGNITGGGGITKEGAATLTLTGATSGTPAVPTVTSSFSGNITINGGKLVGAAAGPVFGSASNTRTITANAGTTLEFQGPNTFGGHSGSNSPTLVVNNATVTNADPLLTDKINNGLRNVTLNNGILTATAGNGTSTIDEPTRPGEGYGCWGLNGTVTSTGLSTISSHTTTKAGRYLLGSGVNTTMNVVDGTLTVSAPLQAGDSGTLGGLIKTGAGKLVLSAANIYSTPTTINGGTLELTGSLLAASGVTTPSNIIVAAGATLMGTGTAAGTLTTDGIVAPGASIGTLAVGTTTFGFTGSLAAEINSTSKTADKLVVTGDLNIASGATLNVTDLGSSVVTSAKLVLISYSGTWDGGTFDGLADGGTLTVNGNLYTIDYEDTDAGFNAVTLRIGTVVADPFDAWASSFGLTGLDAGKGADPDKDGVKNILEFATASSPIDGTSGPRVYPLMFTIGADNALTFTAAVRTGAVFVASGTKQTATRDQVYYTFEATNELGNWTTVPVTEVTGTDATNIRTALGSKLTAPPLGADWEWHTFRTDQGTQVDPSDFIRLRVSDAP